ALDFAFLIHTAVGQHTVGARVNGELVPLRHVLRSGDTVEIVTSPQAQPHEDWLQIVRTAGARAKVRSWLRQRRHADSVTLGREMLERELKRLRHKIDDASLEEIARGLGLPDLDTFYARLGEGQVSITQVMRKLAPPKEGFAERLAKGPLEALGLSRKPTGGVRIQGIDNIMLSFARCCQPVPGDRVIGVITVGRGVSVHRQDCPNTFGDRVPPERKVQVDWDTRAGETFPVRLVVYGQDRTSLLADIAKAIAATQVNIRTAGIASEDRTARGVFVVEVAHLGKLQEVMGAIRSVRGVTRVERRQRLIRSAPPDAPGARAAGDEG
ncbi:MAG TPA: ACT domain-containing protein, partial [Candidatus Eisenbacteria bacterium]